MWLTSWIIYDMWDKLGITSEEVPVDTLQQKLYLEERIWELLLNLHTEFIQNSILDILFKEQELQNDSEYQRYKEKMIDSISNYDITSLKFIRSMYIQSKTITVKIRAMIDALDQVIELKTSENDNLKWNNKTI